MVRYLRLLALALLLAAPGPAAGPGPGPRPFHGRVDATWDNVLLALAAPPAHFQGGGPVTHMGKTAQAGTLTLDYDPSGVFPGVGSVTITAADGDTLTFDYSGLLDSTTGFGVGDFKFTGGTGRFRRARGTGTFHAVIDLSVPAGQAMAVVLDGTIEY